MLQSKPDSRQALYVSFMSFMNISASIGDMVLISAARSFAMAFCSFMALKLNW